MKVEFIKEEKLAGYSIYYTEVNGKFIDGSLSLDEDKAKLMYEHIIKSPSGKSIFTVLKSTEIEENILNSDKNIVNL